MFCGLLVESIRQHISEIEGDIKLDSRENHTVKVLTTTVTLAIVMLYVQQFYNHAFSQKEGVCHTVGRSRPFKVDGQLSSDYYWINAPQLAKSYLLILSLLWTMFPPKSHFLEVVPR
ncbi:hypothetical protein AVEN_71360-1 [Araneus ventricosus]|uniref:Uncharacterized protein n=1 Tax=Araneus ventricosus TaxID=182803 RepID=A0A4Y2BI22_ARAVE|nr:hypothetical protein AVEN_71360-1 [Araneus ventricosus]